MTRKPAWLSDDEFVRAEAARLAALRLVAGVKDKEPWALAEADAHECRERLYALARTIR